MKKIFTLIFLLPLTFLLFTQQDEKKYERTQFYLGGIQINEADDNEWMKIMKNASLNTVHVTVYASQGKWDSDSLIFDRENPEILQEIKIAKENDMKVILILRVAMDWTFEENRFAWHGMIMPRTIQSLKSWFEKYGAFVAYWAKLAEQYQVDVFGIGSELNVLTETRTVARLPELYAYHNSVKKQKSNELRAIKFKQKLDHKDLWINGYENYKDLKKYITERISYKTLWSRQVSFQDTSSSLDQLNERRAGCLQYWKELIAQTRAVYHGKLTYAANHDNYHQVGFWEELDFIGINAYFPLRKNAGSLNGKALKDALEIGWKNAFSEIDAFRTSSSLLKKPILFTELGYINRDCSTLNPWAGFGFAVLDNGAEDRLLQWTKEPYNYNERRMALDALYSYVSKNNINLEGLLYWKLTSHDYHLPYEPFALLLNDEPLDSLQVSLSKFSSLSVSK